MIHGYRVIWGTYGFWLPNDPRGSWSDVVRAWELVRFGMAVKSTERVDVETNPEREGKPRQSWSFVTPFFGILKGGWMAYY